MINSKVTVGRAGPTGATGTLCLEARPPVPGDPLGIHDLTPRERQVLLLLGQAATNREISHSLGIAERTVKSHLTSVMGKLDVTTRTEAAIFSYAHHSALVHEEPDAAAS
ncbi:response regulator transcription factor [Streptomyces bacillaris]|uniref:response regulator transcription factor n=1 Tax=unclassified Streptomyces TaxID=2593676 RepID=UPI000373AAF6|nr:MULTISPECIES: helix-turn-helix transcriptional regulator [unclassified Streptomyces]MYT35951.1 LuxR family transcriptional regulator [Streptomyces sp. SID8356]